jgi:hypothetical protein
MSGSVSSVRWALHVDARLLERADHGLKRCRTDLIVPVSACEQNVLGVGVGQYIRQQLKRRLGPLKVVEDDTEQLVGRGEGLNEFRKHVVEAVARCTGVRLTGGCGP